MKDPKDNNEFFEYPEEVYNTRSAEKIVPILLEWFHPASVLDVGCGNGSWLAVFDAKGISDLMGTDFSEPKQLMIDQGKYLKADLRHPFDLKRKFDLALCLEVAEHIEAEHAEQLIASLTRHSDIIIFSAAIPGQGGQDHLNEKPPAYWQEIFNRHGFHCYDLLRPLIWDDTDINWWYRQNIFIASRSAELRSQAPQQIRWLIHPEFHQIKMKYVDRFNYFLFKLTKTPALSLHYLKRALLLQYGLMNDERKKYYKKRDERYWSQDHYDENDFK
jgi:SAM-dependent methyltransferase